MTSSIGAIHVTKDPTKNEFSVADWSDVTTANLDDKSKTLAESAAWDFQASLPESERFELVAINPTLVLGPNLKTA